MTIVLTIVVIAVVLGFIGLYRWTRTVETSEMDWEPPARDSADRQAAQTGIAMNVNGTFSR